MPDPSQPRRTSAAAASYPILDCTFDPKSLALVRRELGRYGRVSGLNDRLLSNFVLAVNEITTNAVTHAGGHGHLHLWREENTLWCLVEDQGPGISPERLDEAYRRRRGHTGGHGLWLTQHICDAVDIQTSPSSGTRSTR